MSETEKKLQELGLTLPDAAVPVGNYVAALQTGNLVFPINPRGILALGIRWVACCAVHMYSRARPSYTGRGVVPPNHASQLASILLRLYLASQPIPSVDIYKFLHRQYRKEGIDQANRKIDCCRYVPVSTAVYRNAFLLIHRHRTGSATRLEISPASRRLRCPAPKTPALPSTYLVLLLRPPDSQEKIGHLLSDEPTEPSPLPPLHRRIFAFAEAKAI